MSVKLMSLVYDIPVDQLKADPKSILLALADNAWDDGSSCYPSRGLMIHKTNLSASTVQRALWILKDEDFIRKVGQTNMNVVEWELNVAKIESVGVAYQPERPYARSVRPDPVVRETITPSQSDHETVSEPSVNNIDEDIDNTIQKPAPEPTYVPDNGDGVPFEHIMVYHDILAAWKEKFPGKRQPTQTNVKMQRKVKARLKVPSFKARLWDAIKKASTSPSLVKDSWFQLEYLLRNDDNYEKVASGEFDWKDGGKQVADPVQSVAKSTKISKENFTGGGV